MQRKFYRLAAFFAFTLALSGCASTPTALPVTPTEEAMMATENSATIDMTADKSESMENSTGMTDTMAMEGDAITHPMTETVEMEGDATTHPMTETMGAEGDAMMHGAQLALTLTGLEDLGAGWTYEGWLIVDGAPVSTGIFTVDAAGQPSPAEFDLGSPVVGASAFVLTIEPSPDPDPAPSVVHLLAGDLRDGVAQLSAAHSAALGNSLADATGAYILGIGFPAGVTAETSYRNGIWFDNLTLPALSAGWVYEGWVVGAEGPVSTGRFTSSQAIDSDGSGPAAGGAGTGPNFPGQDFLQPLTDLIGRTAVISIEPEPDNSPAPFALKPLVDAAIEDVGDHGSQNLANEAASFPTGVATLVVR